MNILKSFSLIILLSIAVVTQVIYDGEKSRRPKLSPYVLPTEVVKAADLGLHNTASDLIWLSAIQYFGDWQTDKYQKIDDYILLANELDPKFSYPYAFGVLILPSVNMTDQALEIGQRGLENIDDDWRIPYYMATTYHISKNDQENALKYFDISANTPGASDNIKLIAITYGSNANMRLKSKAVWQGIFDNSKDEVVKEKAYNHVLHYEILDFLEKAAEKYKEKFGNYPSDLEQLVSENILVELPIDPLGFELAITTGGRIVIK